MKRREAIKAVALGAAALTAPGNLLAQIERRGAMFPMPGKYTDALRKKFNVVYRYLNAVDIGHGLLAEVLVTNYGNEERAVNLLEDDGFQSVSRMFLDPRKAPRLAVHEETVAPESVKVAPRLNRSFDWTHILHRQIYDVLATDVPLEQKKLWVRESYNWYRSEREDAFPGVLKTHDLMEHQWFSQYWRQKYPRFNAAIWAYHWYQLRLNEVMLDADLARRNAAVTETTAEFRAMFENPDLLPKHMPMAHTIAPTFLAEFPDIANSFDNLHSFHDIYNDILAHPKITDKKAEVYKQLAIFLDLQQAKETAPMHPLPATLSREDHRRLNQLQHLEHMAMMLMPTGEQMLFYRATPEERAATVAKLRPVMAQHWPNFEKKHAEMEHHHH
jgi:hypothetical protein